ncbi:glycosyltransferase family 2 protein [Amycolatopsis jiangsuensis]|uniref:GT2 family glycosyltransferase n=1 Tax=Amycolatopsis jiangsuensis TaxID=1181879 RepID=A0A840IRJ0_9PSEU|nr:glycosyltransferase [Amycolatopsis jiangsuensis]MBB4684453.1 GT2 family glycosyltransferase [Amycolatopsis jiangsuensis]
MTGARHAASVVLCCYTEDRWDDLVEAVKSVGGQTLPPAELVVVVDHNPALLRRAAEAFEAPGVRVLENHRRAGLSGARNTGYRAAVGEIVAFLDDDAAADSWWLEEMLAPYADPAVAAVGGRAIPAWPDDAPPRWLPPELYWIVGCGYTGQPESRAEVRNLMGCAMSFRRKHLEALGGFTESVGRTAALPLGCEETELCIRLRQRVPGAKVVLEPAATVRHRVTRGRTAREYIRHRSWAEGISKAAVSRLVGEQDALETERSYLRAVLPKAVLRELRRGNLAGARGIFVATAAAGAGYVRGRLRRGENETQPSPIPVHTVDLAGGSEVDWPGEAAALVRAGEVVLGSVRRPEDAAGLRERLAELSADRPPRPERLPRVSVVLATAGRPDDVRRCVHSVLATGYPDLEILVVDNVADGPRGPLRELATTDERIRLLHEPVPGAGRARNRGAQAATGTVLAFTDDDTVVDRGWLAELAAELAQPDTPCVTGLVAPLRLDTPAQVWFEAFGGFGKGYRRQAFTADAHRLQSPGRFGSGNNMAWRREDFLALGGFDERLGPGRRTKSGEDLDLYLRLVGSGKRVVYTPHAVVRHEHRGTEEELLRQLRGYGTGLAAMYLLHAARPGGLRELALAVPRGLPRLLGRKSEQSTESAGVPRRLVIEQLKGTVSAPLALLRERAR